MITVEFADSFGEALEALEEFMLMQDGDSALRRVENLQQEIGRFIDLVKKHPRIGRFADLLAVSDARALLWLEQVLKLAAAAGLTEFREYVLPSHVVLHALSDSRVLVLSIRHQRELGYAPDTE
jgi:plasmid stabilization system protein ParE